MLKTPHRAGSGAARRRKLWPYLVLLLLVAALVGGVFSVRQWLFQRWPVTPPGVQRVLIAPGTALPQIARQLQQAGVVSDAARFSKLASKRAVGQKIKAGEYEFSQAATPDQVLDRLVAGDVLKVRVTIPEGFALRAIAARVAAAGLGTVEQFLTAATDPTRLQKLGIPGSSLEGYLFPETYVVTTTTSPIELLRAMFAQLERQLTPELLAAARQRGLNRHQLITLASIVQKEAGNDAEMPLIAGVFHNRLRKGMPLQADPTVIYGIADFDGNLTRRHLTTPTPYNTYTRKGLPPGPIASPGLVALRAAAFPAETKALYFVARGNGLHEFNATLEAHNRAVNRYQRRGR